MITRSTETASPPGPALSATVPTGWRQVGSWLAFGVSNEHDQPFFRFEDPSRLAARVTLYAKKVDARSTQAIQDVYAHWDNDTRSSHFVEAGYKLVGKWDAKMDRFYEDCGWFTCETRNVAPSDRNGKGSWALSWDTCDKGGCGREGSLTVRTIPYTYVAPIAEKNVIKVYWAEACRGSQNCDTSIQQGWSSNKKMDETHSSEFSTSLANSMTTTANAGASGEFMGIAFEGSLETVNQTDTNYSTQIKQASQIVRTTSANSNFTCGTKVDMSDGLIQGVYQWVTEMAYEDQVITVRSCTVACTPDGSEPTFTPNSKEFVNSCNPKYRKP